MIASREIGLALTIRSRMSLSKLAHLASVKAHRAVLRVVIAGQPTVAVVAHSSDRQSRSSMAMQEADHRSAHLTVLASGLPFLRHRHRYHADRRHCAHSQGCQSAHPSRSLVQWDLQQIDHPMAQAEACFSARHSTGLLHIQAEA